MEIEPPIRLLTPGTILEIVQIISIHWRSNALDIARIQRYMQGNCHHQLHFSELDYNAREARAVRDAFRTTAFSDTFSHPCGISQRLWSFALFAHTFLAVFRVSDILGLSYIAWIRSETTVAIPVMVLCRPCPNALYG